MSIESEIEEMFRDLQSNDIEGLTIINVHTQREKETLDRLYRIYNVGSETGPEDLQIITVEETQGDDTLGESDV